MVESYRKELINHAIDKLRDSVSVDRTEGNEIHNILFNQDYFIIGYWNAEQWLLKHAGIFQAIEDIKDYEQKNFGEVTTDFSNPETVCNMFAYIKGEEILSELVTLSELWDKVLSQEDTDSIVAELEELLTKE